MKVSSIIHTVVTTHKAIAITFDDGPNPQYTPEVMELFEECGGKATFYMIGEQMLANPEIVSSVIAKGHEIGNHTFTHPHLTELSTEDCIEELEKTDELIAEMTGKSPLTFRPPFLSYNEDVAVIVEQMGYRVIGASNMETRDWEQPGVQHIIDKTLMSVQCGSVLLFHDGYGDRSQTVEAIRYLLPKLTAEGYKLVTISELLAMSEN